MRRLTSFTNLSLDGYFADPDGGLSWAHNADPEWTAFVAENARGGGVLVMGRTTYEMMVSYWPTPMAAQQNPVVAKRMNEMPKIVFSRTLQSPAWANTTVVTGDIVARMRALKQESGPNLAILGSGTIVSQLAQAGLVDELQLAVHPLVLGAGRSMFESVTEKLALTLTSTRAFGNGNVVLSYAPVN
jgi:dihydrofolate reductase